jgi:hypothetical protein
VTADKDLLDDGPLRFALSAFGVTVMEPAQFLGLIQSKVGPELQPDQPWEV